MPRACRPTHQHEASSQPVSRPPFERKPRRIRAYRTAAHTFQDDVAGFAIFLRSFLSPVRSSRSSRRANDWIGSIVKHFSFGDRSSVRGERGDGHLCWPARTGLARRARLLSRRRFATGARVSGGPLLCGFRCGTCKDLGRRPFDVRPAQHRLTGWKCGSPGGHGRHPSLRPGSWSRRRDACCAGGAPA